MKNFENLEPTVGWSEHQQNAANQRGADEYNRVYLYSIAVSLKRIADALEKPA